MSPLDTCFPHCGKFPYTWAGRPRRMARAEIAIWHDYQRLHPLSYINVWYDAIIPRDYTQPPPHPERCDNVAENCDRTWTNLNSLRADVIAESRFGFTIIELREVPTEDNYGRLLRYDWIARHAWPDLRWLSPLMLCRQAPRLPLTGGEWDQIVTLEIPPPATDDNTMDTQSKTASSRPTASPLPRTAGRGASGDGRAAR